MILLSVRYVQFSLRTYRYLSVPLGNRKEAIYSYSQSKHNLQFIISVTHQTSTIKDLII